MAGNMPRSAHRAAPTTARHRACVSAWPTCGTIRAAAPSLGRAKTGFPCPAGAAFQIEGHAAQTGLHMRKNLKKPEFIPKGSLWIDDDYLPRDITDILFDILKQEPPVPFSDDQAIDLIHACSEAAQFTNDFEEGTNGEAHKELQILIAKTKATLKAMSELSELAITNINIRTAEIYLSTNHHIELNSVDSYKSQQLEEGAFLESTWKTLEDLCSIAEYTVEKMAPMISTGSKVSILKAKRLTYFIAQAHQRIRGDLPPKSKETWFPRFMAELASWNGLKTRTGTPLKCGPDLVADVIDAMRQASGNRPVL